MRVRRTPGFGPQPVRVRLEIRTVRRAAPFASSSPPRRLHLEGLSLYLIPEEGAEHRVCRRSADKPIVPTVGDLGMDGLAPAYVRRLSEATERGRALMKACGSTRDRSGCPTQGRPRRRARTDASRLQPRQPSTLTGPNLSRAAELRRTASALKSQNVTGRRIATSSVSRPNGYPNYFPSPRPEVKARLRVTAQWFSVVGRRPACSASSGLRPGRRPGGGPPGGGP